MERFIDFVIVLIISVVLISLICMAMASVMPLLRMTFHSVYETPRMSYEFPQRYY
ncbi:hypothetical protein [Staphylococcus gallinarum]|uniref:hypothetical protein n=1 Tax=Staphylococcus gallinarum TaxID=1293 RepID=UPI0015FD9E19|nr:hypothetical protein [Staphylococcus gallinarum]